MNPGNLQERLHDAAEKGELDDIKIKISNLQAQLKIPTQMAKEIKGELDKSYVDAEQAVALVGGSDDDLAKMWGYNYGSILYKYLNQRDSLDGRRALSFIKMALGFELASHGYTEIQYSSFVLGLGLRFQLGFENLKKSIAEIELELLKLDKIPDEK
ncbi:MAG: hypothetical protein ACXACB_14910 [Promethearchaeota archaeon]|jgi:hypothetical protein